MLLRCCLIHLSIIILRHYFSLSSSLRLIVLSHEFRRTYSFAYFLEKVLLFSHEGCEQFSTSKSSASRCCLAFLWFFAYFSLALLIKMLLIKKGVFKAKPVSKKSLYYSYIHSYINYGSVSWGSTCRTNLKK